MKETSLEGKTVIVTGGGRGLGRAMAFGLAEEGANVCIAAHIKDDILSVEEDAKIEIITDSKYVKNGINQWIVNWKNNGWKTAAKKPVKNIDLWKELDELVQNFSIEWKWVKGHSGHLGNERADQLANEAIIEFYDKNS